MKKLYVFAPAALMAFVSLSSLAVQKDITITADIDPTIELLQSDGTPLPSALKMTYLPGVGLLKQTLSTKIFTNDPAKNVEMRLLTSPVLASTTKPTAKSIPLSVSYNGKVLTTAVTADSTLKAAELFPNGRLDNGSVPFDLVIAQATPAVVTESGSYQGVVSLVLNTATATP
ncbi:fimbrial protein [Klebsiella aerogenes]|uniref:CS1 type fimbrial major subunit n=1 Tax=Klebsiella aerogenes TaxID=548 RepID=UPI000F7F1482|nr:CS1 type fimbrial major subunit [Klebsiella aerogenes]RSV86548.1 Cro/Cl family transcriptional regulator [Klebsiella aerogenes]HBY1220632.1 fimbrial protein [Klebsiella aerogenes]HBY9708563.1 fimbrial protein [Klebsiella aerogenes]